MRIIFSYFDGKRLLQLLNKAVGYVFKFVPTLIALLVAAFSVVPANFERLPQDIAAQSERIAALERAYASGEIDAVDESTIFAGNLSEALSGGVRFNELCYIATHNSYQTAGVDERKTVITKFSDLTFGLVKPESANFANETLTQQLNCGIRSFEIDIETFERDGEISFTCMHSPCFDMTTSCYDFELMLKEIALWSDNNHDHLPITIIIEPKSFFLPMKDMHFFNINYAKELDKAVRRVLGDRLFTPADMLGNYENFGQMRADDGWRRVDEMLGKVLILLHEGSVTEKYIGIDPSVKTQAMFPMLREADIDRDCASFIIVNSPKKIAKISDNVIGEKKLIVRTMCDSFPNHSQEQLAFALDSGTQIISTDFPIKTDLKDDDYFVTFGGYTTVR